MPTVLCKVTCTRGQRCSQEACNPCPAGYFQDEPVHQHTKCKKWTYKPPYLNFVTKTPGTLTRDVEWTCEKGYGLFQYTPGEFECRKIVTTSSTTTTIPATTEYRESTSQTQKINSTSHISGSSGKNEHLGLKTGILLPLLGVCLLAMILLIFVGFVAFNRRKRNGQKVRFTERKDPNVHGKKAQGTKIRRRRSKEFLNFTFFSSIINQLGEDSEAFIHHLKDDSRTFVAESSIHFCKEDFRPVQTAYTNVCLQWVAKNKGNPRLTQYIVNALGDIGRNDVIESCELSTDDTVEMETMLL